MEAGIARSHNLACSRSAGLRRLRVCVQARPATVLAAGCSGICKGVSAVWGEFRQTRGTRWGTRWLIASGPGSRGVAQRGTGLHQDQWEQANSMRERERVPSYPLIHHICPAARCDRL
mgnify:CR=1 FL=1